MPEDEGKPAAYRNVSTHWWDASQIYGRSKERQLWLRTESPVVEHAAAAVENGSLLPDGKLYLPNGHLPWFAMKRGNNASALLELSGEPGNGWLGLSMFHTIFAREHNHLCDALAREYPHRAQDGEWLFQKSRLIVAALLAKIHTVEWTPAILNTPELRFSMRANWWGIQGQRLVDGFGRFSKTELMGGIIESATDHHSAEYSITEEFNAVYRMHSLLPDHFALRRHGDDSGLFAGDRTLHDIAGSQVPLLYKEQGVSLADASYSMGTEHPGLLKLNNFPTELQGLKKQAPSARPGTRRPALLRLPLRVADAGTKNLRGAVRASGAVAGGLRLFRYRFSDLHSHGVAPPQERPLLHHPLHAGGLHSIRVALGPGDNGMTSVRCVTCPSSRRGSMGSRTPSSPGTERGKAMSRSLRIPWLADLLFVDRLDALAELDRQDQIDRELTPNGPLLNRLILRRTARLAHQGTPWPAFLPRDTEGRAEKTRALAARLDGIAPDDLAGDPDVEALGAWVAGGAGSLEEAGIRLQRLVGVLFVDDYQADESSWLAACRIRQWTRADPLIVLWLSLSGRGRAAKRLLLARAGGDLHCVHATAIAVHNLVDAVERLKGLLSDPDASGRVREDTAPVQCLRAPTTLLRNVTSQVLTTQRHEPLRPGSLVVVRLDAATRGTADLEAMFHVGSWAGCPAHGFVIVLLRAIRRAAGPHLERAAASTPGEGSGKSQVIGYPSGNVEHHTKP